MQEHNTPKHQTNGRTNIIVMGCGLGFYELFGLRVVGHGLWVRSYGLGLRVMSCMLELGVTSCGLWVSRV